MKKLKQFLRQGEPFLWGTGGALALTLIFVLGLFYLILVKGMGFFWPTEITQITLQDGSVAMGQIRDREMIPDPDAEPGSPIQHRINIRVGNREPELYGFDFRWVDEEQITAAETPAEAILVERREWSNLYAFLKEIRVNGKPVPYPDAATMWEDFQKRSETAFDQYEAVQSFKKNVIGDITRDQEAIRLALRGMEMVKESLTASDRNEMDRLQVEAARLQEEFERREVERAAMREEMDRASFVVTTVDGLEKEVAFSHVVRAYRPNEMGWFSKVGVYIAKFWEFLTAEPRETNTEGGVFPAIFGTVLMVLLMTIAVVPFGILAALYLREYAKQGLLVRAVRIGVNNLAGVPSIVFGVFGLGFFVYFVGGTIDQLFFPEALPTPTYGTSGILWASLTLALLTVPVVIVATEEGLAAVPKDIRHGSLALGATKWETIRKIVIPGAMPGILTGVILAIARATGEVAPLMITGVVKLAPSLPVDGYFPYLHLERKFMHLGFHIYDVGFQSPNVEAAKPMVYTTSLLLLAIVVALNITAIWIRNRLRKKYKSAAF